MSSDFGSSDPDVKPVAPPDRRDLLKWTATGALGAGLAAIGAPRGEAAAAPEPGAGSMQAGSMQAGPMHRRMIGFMLAHEQFPVPELVKLGASASRGGFDLLALSDHLQPWQDNQGHAGSAWVTMAATGAQAPRAWMGTAVTCPTLRYNPAVVAEAFSSMSLLYPGRIFLGVGSGEALNEQAATGEWPKWPERWERLVEAIGIIRELWTGRPVDHKGKYYNVTARLYDPPAHPIPILTAANGKKSMRLAGQHGDGLITDPMSWKKFKGEWQAGARDAGKNPADMPVLVEQYVVVGDKADAQRAAEYWRFGPKSWKTYYNVVDPVQIRQKADAEVAYEKVTEGWPIGTDPALHIAKVRELFDSGVTIVNIHAGQPDQKRVVDFYASHVLPAFKRPA